MAIEVRLTVADMARVRLAISPLAEMVSSLMLLHDDPVPNELHRPWRRRVGAALPLRAKPAGPWTSVRMYEK